MTEINITTEEEFDTLEPAYVPMLILVTAPSWCAPCRAFEPHWKKAQESLKGHTFVKIDAGETPEDTGAHWVSERFKVRGVPFVFLIDDDLNTRPINSRAVVPFVKEVTDG